MMIRTVTVAAVLMSLIALPAAAAPKKMSIQALDQVVAGHDDCGRHKGNNGWGNGADPSNAGSDNGGTSSSKMANYNLPPGQNKINTNPTNSTGR